MTEPVTRPISDFDPSLVGLIEQVDRARQQLTALESDIQGREQGFRASIAPILEAKGLAKRDLEVTENLARDAILEYFRETGLRHEELAPGASVALTEQLTYTEDQALHWAVDHKRYDLLEVKRGPLREELKRLIDERKRPIWAKLVQQPVVRLASNLGVRLKEARDAESHPVADLEGPIEAAKEAGDA